MTAAIRLDRSRTEMDSGSQNRSRVLAPGDPARAGLYPLTPVKLRQLASQPALGVDLLKGRRSTGPASTRASNRFRSIGTGVREPNLLPDSSSRPDPTEASC